MINERETHTGVVGVSTSIHIPRGVITELKAESRLIQMNPGGGALFAVKNSIIESGTGVVSVDIEVIMSLVGSTGGLQLEVGGLSQAGSGEQSDSCEETHFCGGGY
jgi:hypothetical protein